MIFTLKVLMGINWMQKSQHSPIKSYYQCTMDYYCNLVN